MKNTRLTKVRKEVAPISLSRPRAPGTAASCIADALVIAQQKDPIFQDPRLVMLELTLATHVLEAAS